jgi:lysophospholipase L1-like esterase
MMKRIVLWVVLLVCGTTVWAEKIKVACIGDSITFGLTVPQRETNAYPAQLQKLLGDKYEVRNFGNSGRGIYLHSWRGKERRGFRFMPEHKAALEWQPNIVVCNLGINDNGEFNKHEATNPGAWAQDYCTLLKDYQALPTKPKLYIWGKLAPLAPGQKFYRSAEPFLMQTELKKVAKEMNATLIDMQEPLRDGLLTLFPDNIHPNADGAKIIAEVTHKALTTEPLPPVTLPEDIRDTAEVWLCAGQSNMFWPLGRCEDANTEADATADIDLRIWNATTDEWIRITPQNAKQWTALGVSFGIRRAKASGKPVILLLVCAGGAPTEAFLDEATMAALTKTRDAKYPNLLKIVTDRRQIDTNEAFPGTWCAREYRRRLNAESKWWGLGALHRQGIARVKDIPLTGILWYQGESNATTGVGHRAGKPLAEDYMRETLYAIVDELRPNKKTPFLMMGLPVMDRDWEPYRKLQQEVCKDTGAIYLNTFKAGLGAKGDVHPRKKVPFAEMASEAATKALKKK